jgi:hypothetical protein
MTVPSDENQQASSDAAQVSGYDRLRAARQAIDDLLTTVHGTASTWGADLLSALGLLQTALERHRDASERPGGTLETALAAKPGLAHAVRRQRREHVSLLGDVARLKAELSDDLHHGAVDHDALAWQVGALQDAVRRHMGRGSDLLHEAFFREEGGES